MDPPGPVAAGPSSAGADAQQHQHPAVQPPAPPPEPQSRYEAQKRRDWSTFLQYLRNHRPPLAPERCSGAHVIEFLRYLDQFGKTKVHAAGCAYYGQPNPPDPWPCPCPLRQSWGSLDALTGRLRAAYEESGHAPESNPFSSRAVRIYLREVRDAQARVRGVAYDKKSRKRNKPPPGTGEWFLPKTQVEVHSTDLYGDLMAWLAMREQWQQTGLHHACLHKAPPQHQGRDDIKKLITEEILLSRNGGNNITVICIVSESGLGKTSVLHDLHSNQQLLDAFDMSIRIRMSDKFDREMLFGKIIEVATHVHCRVTNLGFLQEMVRDVLTDKKFLLFLDDADKEDRQFWIDVLEVLNAGAQGSVIVMATRSATVATLTCEAAHSYHLGPLSEENNLMLLQQYDGEEGHDIKSNPELVALAKKFISRFGANTLYLKALGGLLCHTVAVQLEKEKLEGNIVSCLQLCHDVLPIHLKKCLAFCSLFPEGYVFDKHHTVLQWISHGCVKPVEGCELEDVGTGYFNELCRSFFEYSPSHDYKDDKFVIHELMFRLIESASRDKYFKSEDPVSSIPENTLHLSLVSSQFQTVELMSKTEEVKDLQTFLVVQPECEWQPYNTSFPTLNLVGLDNFFLKFTSLETLDLSHTDIEELPGSIAGLRNLQYLSVNNTSIRALPSELCSLCNLHTFEAKHCRFLTELPGGTKRLVKLRHLDVTKELDYVHLPHGVGDLTELRTLPVFHASSDSSHYCSISELGSLRNLRGCLRLSGLESVGTGGEAQEANLKGKQNLRDLTLQWSDTDSGADIDSDDDEEEEENVAEQVLQNLQPHADIQELAIRGYGGSAFPAWMQSSSSLPSLVSLTLDGCCCCTQFPAVAHLPSLKFLSARRMYGVQRLSDRNDMDGATKFFPPLELLNLWEMYGLEELFEASAGDCPRLRKVCTSRCPDLKRLPRAPSLAELVLHCGDQLPDIPELASLVSLRIEGFHGVTSLSLPPPAALPVLKKLEIRSCNKLSSVDFF